MTKKKIKYSIHASREILTFKPILPYFDHQDNGVNALSFFDLENNQFLSDWVEDPNADLTKSRSAQLSDHVMAIKGNLLTSLPNKLKPVEISHIDNIPLHFLEDISGSGIACIHKSPSNGKLQVYCRSTDNHQAGDFIYTLGTQEPEKEVDKINTEIFSYTLLDKNHKQITLQLSIQLSEEDIDVDLPDLGFIQEEDLMMGSFAKTRGILPNMPTRSSQIHQKNSNKFKFLPIDQQYSLKSMHLTANNLPLLYEIDEQGSRLLAKQVQTQQTIFSAKIEPKGLYDFELHHPIDRAAQTNLMSGNFKRTKSSLYQDIHTKVGKIYEFSFYFKPMKEVLPTPLLVELWWAGLLIGIIQLMSETLKGYHFTLEGQNEITRLELKIPESIQDSHPTVLSTQIIAEHLDMATLVPEEQTQVRFELAFENSLGITNQFPITINLEHEIIISQAAPYTITIDDLSPYKKIVLSDNLVHEDNLATTLNLEKIFTHMQIPEAHRHVEVAQLEHTNIYEVKISDKTDLSAMPVTVADIELKFDGGNQGLDLLFKYLTIDI